jgi:hypothetical protein
MINAWNYQDQSTPPVYINRISNTGAPVTSPSTPTENSQINTTGWISVNQVNIDGQGNILEYQGNTPYWISTEKLINNYDSPLGANTPINNAWTVSNFYAPAERAAAINYTIKSSDPNKLNQLNLDIVIQIKDTHIVSQMHEIAHHLNYSWGVYVPQPISNMSFKNCVLQDNAVYRDYKLDFDGVKLDPDDQAALAIANAGYTDPNFRGQYIKATNRWNGIETHFGSEIWLENRIKPNGTSTGFFIPTNKYMLIVEGRNWTNEGYFEMNDCVLNGSSSTMIFIKNTSIGFRNLKLRRNGSFISYGGDGVYDGLGKDYYNHQVDLSWDPNSTAYAYSPYSNVGGTVKKAKAWINRYMPKKNLFYIRLEGETGTTNGGISKNAWCRVIDLDIENSFPVTTYRNNQRRNGIVPTFGQGGNLNSQNVGGTSPYNPQTWVDDTAPSNNPTGASSLQINYNQTGYFKLQIGGSDALFKIDGNSYFRVDTGYVYGEQVNNLIHKSQYTGVDFTDCNFDAVACVDIPGADWSSSDNDAKRGAFKLATTQILSGLGINRSINLYNSKVNFVMFRGASPYPLANEFYDALRDGKGWDPNFIYPFSPDSTVNKVSFSSTTPLIGGNDTIPSLSNSPNSVALNTNVGYNPYKLIPGNKYYNTSGGLTVIKVPNSPGVTIALPVEFGTVTSPPAASHFYQVNPS